MNPLFLALLLAHDATPRATVQSFVDALRAYDAPAAARRVVGGRPVATPLVAGLPTLRVVLGEERIDGDTATVEVEVNVVLRIRPLPTVHETVDLRRIGGDWRIVPASVANPTQPRSPDDRRHLVAEWARLVTDESLMATARRSAYASQALIESKSIALAAIMYSADHGDHLPSAVGFRPAIAPYLKKVLGPHPTNPNPFVAPGAPKDTTFFLDPRLSGRSLTSIDQISAVAMIVMGKEGRATYPYGGQTIMSFTDGHVKRIRPAAAFKARTIPLG